LPIIFPKENLVYKSIHMGNRIKRVLLLLFMLSGTNAFSQSDFDAQIKKMSDTLVNRLLKTGKKRVAVSNFVDLQGNVTELGKYIAESFSVELSNTELNVVDRSRIKDLLEELKLTEEKLTKPENALKLGEMAGVEFIITGTTTPLDNTVNITMKALDIQNGTSVAGQRGTLPRTDAINNLMNSNINEGNTTAANVNAGKKIDTKNRSAADVIFEVGVSDLRNIECETPNIYMQSRIDFYGQACFENQTEFDLTLIVSEPGVNGIKILIPKGSRNCYPKIILNYGGTSNTTKDVIFNFTTVETMPIKRGTFVLTLEKCKLKSVVLTKKNIFFESTQ